jgi:hypothetical protein
MEKENLGDLANISLGNNANMKGRPETAGLPMMGL